MILHIANDFNLSKVHSELYRNLDRLDVAEDIYIPLRKKSRKGNNHFEFIQKQSSYIYSRQLKGYHRLLFGRKINWLYESLIQSTDVEKYSIIHATTLFSDGGIAYMLKKKYGKPYIVAVRNTDLNLFFKYMIHLREFGLDVLRNADKIVFIAPSYLKRLYSLPYLSRYKDMLEKKSVVIPNGIDQFWIDFVEDRKSLNPDKLHLLYIGSFNKGKNIIGLLKATQLLREKGINVHLNIVGDGGKDYDKMLKYIDNNKDAYSYHGRITDKESLKQLFRKSDIFVMPSHNETFGLVYIEALSQGLPIVYTKNEGIDGIYDSSIGEAVDSYDVEDIAKGIERIYIDYPKYNFNPKEIVRNHSWDRIATKYFDLYQEVLAVYKGGQISNN